MPWSFMGRRERMRRQASEWLARLNGPHDELDRAAFDRWYRESPDHAAAFNPNRGCGKPSRRRNRDVDIRSIFRDDRQLGSHVLQPSAAGGIAVRRRRRGHQAKRGPKDRRSQKH